MLGDAYVFQREIRHTIEHGGTSNSIPTDYCATTYFYAKQRPSLKLSLPPLAERQVVDLQEIIFPAGWQIPISAFCFDKASISRRVEKIDGQDVRSLVFTAAGPDWSGPPFLSLTCEVPNAGAYEIYLEAVKGPAQGKVQLFQNEVPIAAPVDLYAPTRGLSGRVALGKLTLAEGPNNLMLKLVGKNEQAESLRLDLIQVVCVHKP
jgi:hypothetical protein